MGAMRIPRRVIMYANSFRSKWPYDLTYFFVLAMVNIKFSGGHSDRGSDDTDGAALHPEIPYYMG